MVKQHHVKCEREIKAEGGRQEGVRRERQADGERQERERDRQRERDRREAETRLWRDWVIDSEDERTTGEREREI